MGMIGIAARQPCGMTPRTGMARGIVAAAVVAATVAHMGTAQAGPVGTLGMSYAYYDPLSLVLKEKSFLQDAVGSGVTLNWVLSQGSNKALEFLRGNSIQFGQTAGSAALLGRANAAPVQVIAVTATSEWTALVVRPRSGIAGLADLEGKRVAVTPGTDPDIFLLRALATVGLGAGTFPWCRCSTRSAGRRWMPARSMPGPASTRSWRKRSCRTTTCCCTATRR